MTITRMRLVDGEREMLLFPRDSFVVLPESLDVPFPAVREVIEPRTDADGERDTTVFHGSRAVAMEIALFDTPAVLFDELIGYLNPSSRPYLYVDDDEWAGERRLKLRADQQSSPRNTRDASHARVIQVQWKAPDGIWESVSETTVVVGSDTASRDGLALTSDGAAVTSDGLVLAGTTAGGASTFIVPGTVPLHFVARLYGPCVAPRLTLDNTGESIVFTDESVPEFKLLPI